MYNDVLQMIQQGNCDLPLWFIFIYLIVVGWAELKGSGEEEDLKGHETDN